MSATVAMGMPVQVEARADVAGKVAGDVAEAVTLKGLPNWYFPLVGLFAGIFDIARAYPVLYALVPVVAVVQIVLAFTVLRARIRYMKSLWKNKRTRFLALGLLVVRFVIRWGLGVAGLALGAVAGQLTLGIVMAVIGTAMAWGDQWLILRTLKHAQAAQPAAAA
ncbi:hypothetical protein [Streptomyces sp. NBC_00083]|uniref:hypothetical protein n=1 Tax=Streptomyces sp. NBC_00083 TaxID=2975647 RepID=UPI002253DD14|nr:hypothetical protein [Streptomyces sp. NBC_00083]MCX5388208.1 hypothetical protein [Streptomyces sp. NBC_00083]